MTAVREAGQASAAPPFLGIAQPDLRDEEIDELLDSIRSGWLTAGPKVARFEALLREYLGAGHVRCLNSCTAGLTLALRLAGVGAGDEVLVPANTFVACANAVEHAGARPVLVDSEPGTGLMDLAHAVALVGPRTRAVMPVHLAGRPLDQDALGRFRDRFGVAVIEDAAHAIGAEWRGRRVGSWGNLCSFSFHATKNITTFEGGALVVRDEAEAARVKRLALHGLDRSAWSRHGTESPDRYDVPEPGFKFAMTDVSAAVGLHQLRRLDAWIDRREQLARHYDACLADLPVELAPPVPAGARHARHVYSVLVRPDAAATRDELVAELRARNIGSTVHFHGIHLQSYYAERYRLRPEDLPVASDWADRSITLPFHPRLTEADVERVAVAVAAGLSARVAA
ncbi:MAG TPA: DegT/DnrJ/EryC1/StrS family aminotransferase [Solirubrobacteraceae bacterium]|nr:DegT/DnrJ/EryC1/StrS family aminotransferase [Solirubrobacteraceae bacterium]